MGTTAIIIFADAARKAARHKILLKDPQRNLALFEHLNREVLNRAKATGLTYFVFDETTPEGYITGEYMADAMTSIFCMGYEKVMIIWNNCMALDDAMMRKAIQELQYAPLVVGPAHWGGVYLVGISHSAFSRVAFMGLGWGSNLLAHDLSCYHEGRVVLPALRVLNSPYSMRMVGIARFLNRLAAILPFVTLPGLVWAKLKALTAKLRHGTAHGKLPAEAAK